jgi:hypothetical protein
MSPDDRSRRQHPAAPAPSPVEEEGGHSLADGGNSVACDVGDLVASWVGIRMDEVDDLVAEARSKVDALPDQRQLWLLFGEALVRLHCLELEVAGLRVEVDRLRQRGRRAA